MGGGVCKNVVEAFPNVMGHMGVKQLISNLTGLLGCLPGINNFEWKRVHLQTKIKTNFEDLENFYIRNKL